MSSVTPSYTASPARPRRDGHPRRITTRKSRAAASGYLRPERDPRRTLQAARAYPPPRRHLVSLRILRSLRRAAAGSSVASGPRRRSPRGTRLLGAPRTRRLRSLPPCTGSARGAAACPSGPHTRRTGPDLTTPSRCPRAPNRGTNSIPTFHPGRSPPPPTPPKPAARLRRSTVAAASRRSTSGGASFARRRRLAWLVANGRMRRERGRGRTRRSVERLSARRLDGSFSGGKPRLGRTSNARRWTWGTSPWRFWFPSVPHRRRLRDTRRRRASTLCPGRRRRRSDRRRRRARRRPARRRRTTRTTGSPEPRRATRRHTRRPSRPRPARRRRPRARNSRPIDRSGTR